METIKPIKQFDIYSVPIINKNKDWRKVNEPLSYDWYILEREEWEKHPRVINLKQRNSIKGCGEY